MTKELNNFTHRSKLDLIKMYKKCRRDIRRLSRQKIELEKLLEEEKKLNAEIKARFVKCNTCTDEMKDKCLMFSENLCEGERCEELVDLMALVSKNDLQKENEQLKEKIEKMKCCGNCRHRHYWGNELGCNLDFDKQFECDNNNKKYWEFSEG